MIQMKFSPRQSQAWSKLSDPNIQVVLYGGAKGGGKSVFGVRWIFLKALEIIQRFGLTPTKYPIPIAFMGRKQGVDFTDTTLETWKRFIPGDTYVVRPGEKEIIIEQCVKVHYGGFDDREVVKKFNSAEYAYGFVDQAEETSRDDYGLLRGTLRLKIHDTPLDYKVLLTANPAVCWLKDEFIVDMPEHSAFVQALPADNPFLPDTYVDNLREAFKHRPELVDAYIHGSWDVIAGADLVIKPGWVEGSVKRILKHAFNKVVVACDPARFGNDETVIYVFKDEQIIDSLIYGQKATMETAGHLARLKNKYQAKLVAIDVVGVGAGISDRLRELKIPVLDVHFGSKASTEIKETKYYNRRAEVYWEAGEKIADEKVSIPDDIILRRQLVNVRYWMNSKGKIQIEPKADIKERMSGQSPDRADAFVLGLHALDFVGVPQKDFQRTQHPFYQKSGYGWRQPNIGAIYGY